MKKSVVIFGSIALAGTIGLYAFNQYRLADKLCYGTEGFRFKKFGINDTIIGINLTIKNKDKLKADLIKTRLKVTANKIPVTEISQTKSAEIAPNATTSVPLDIRLNPRQVLGNISAITGGAGLDNVVLKFKGWITVKKFGIPFPIPLSFKYTIRELRSDDGTTEC